MAIQMEAIIKKSNVMNRIKRLDDSSSKVNNHFVFKESLNFNFLYHLFSQTLEYLFNNIEKITEKEFIEKMLMLDETVSRLQNFVIE